ncbi:ATP-binding protein [Streptomyces ipomoeae]|uniref:ATP-binding protein n=1 Tax=Streptomyces ipomoeae TaxID=103232 RepID=UPI0035A6998B
MEEVAFTTELVVSEPVTNAVRHGGGPIGLRLIRDGVLICEVTDSSNTQPRLRRTRSSDEGGRGLFLTAQLTTRWGSRYGQSGKTVWAEESLTAPDIEQPPLVPHRLLDHPPAPTVPLEAARAGGLVGVDTNADRLAAWRLDAHGNPVGAPRRFGYDLTGNVAHRDAQIRHALIRLLLPHGPNATVWQSGSRTSTSPRRRPGRSTAAGSGSATLSPACP